jgi:hypothetical protein
MAKKKVVKAAAASSDIPGHPKVNLDDQNSLRCQLDEAAAEVGGQHYTSHLSTAHWPGVTHAHRLQVIRQSGYKEYFTVTYVKIALGLCACVLPAPASLWRCRLNIRLYAQDRTGAVRPVRSWKVP